MRLHIISYRLNLLLVYSGYFEYKSQLNNQSFNHGTKYCQPLRLVRIIFGKKSQLFQSLVKAIFI
jgi:hypothetical protein